MRVQDSTSLWGGSAPEFVGSVPWLPRTDLSSGLHDLDLPRLIATFGTRVRLAAGDALTGAGARARHLCLVTSGRIAVVLENGTQRVGVAEFRRGAGFVFNLGGKPGTKCRALVDSEVIDFPLDLLRNLARRRGAFDGVLRALGVFDADAFLEDCFAPAVAHGAPAARAARALRTLPRGRATGVRLRPVPAGFPPGRA